MLPLFLLLPAALTLASPTSSHTRRGSDSEAPPELLVRYHHESGSNQTEFSLSTPSKDDVYAHACSNSLEVAGETVTISVNERGSGSIAVGDKKYKIVGDREVSGGASCTKMYGETSTVVECLVPWSDGFRDLAALDGDEVEECFSAEGAARRRSLPGNFGAPFAFSRSGIEKRYGATVCPPPSENTELVGDGNPHQDTFHQQVGASQHCAQSGTCNVGVGKEVSITVSAEIGAGAWITGGFAVSKSITSSTTRGCEAEEDSGDTVCQWSRTHHTAYTVRTSRKTLCGLVPKEEFTDPYVMRSPNEGSLSTEWYCVINTCRGDGDSYWELGRAGGPGPSGAP